MTNVKEGFHVWSLQNKGHLFTSNINLRWPYSTDINLCLSYNGQMKKPYFKFVLYKLDINIDHLFIKISLCIFYVCCQHVRHKLVKNILVFISQWFQRICNNSFFSVIFKENIFNEERMKNTSTTIMTRTLKL